ncbi:MAG: LPP20 family lipoprotein [Deltaproteobacteria bacterium]|nr:LPP20 family lipoprotein [Deltaproteobacteria bacterium]
MKSSTFFLRFLAIALLLIPPVALANKQPDWISGGSTKYPEERYFIGVGAVSSAKGGKKQQHEWAGDQARAEIAKIFKTQVSVATRAERQVESGGEGDQKKLNVQASQTDLVTASASEMLQGVEIKEYYEDKKGQRLFALAVLDRAKASRRLESSIEQLKREMLTEIEAGRAAQEEKQLFLSLRHYRKALEVAQAIPPLGEHLSILRPGALSSAESETDHASEIKSVLYALRKRIRFNLEISGPAEGVKIYLIQGLSKEGFLTEKQSSSDSTFETYRLVGTTDLTSRGSMPMGSFEVQIYQADLDLEVKNPQNGETLGALTWSVSANEKSSDLAAKSAVRALGQAVKEQVGKRLMEIF